MALKFTWTDTDIAKMNPAGPGTHRVRLNSVESRVNKDKTGTNIAYEFTVDDKEDAENGQSVTQIRPMAYPGLHADMHAALMNIAKEDFAQHREYDLEDLVGKTAYVTLKKEIDTKTQEIVLRDKAWYADKGERPHVDE